MQAELRTSNENIESELKRGEGRIGVLPSYVGGASEMNNGHTLRIPSVAAGKTSAGTLPFEFEQA
jgi:hypothetical protein